MNNENVHVKIVCVKTHHSAEPDFFIREQLVIVSEIFRDAEFPPTPRTFDIWVRLFRNVPVPRLELAFDQLLKTWKPDYGRKFPVPSDLTAILEPHPKLVLDEQVETTWQKTLKSLTRQYHPDLGWRGPELDERVRRALEAAGGIHYVWMAPADQLVWAKKAFVEAYLRAIELEKHAGLLPENGQE